ncbi:MAG: ABC transporter ATP-binding protein [Flammeovirgaceae bacterium]|nr:ABC transporter ATP-binding protein [Flammeovirgaceae bacterium]
MISVHNLNKKFGSLEVLKSIDLDFQLGKSFALIGPNGSGKTTLIKCILGMVMADSGVIKVDNENINGQWLYRDKIGYMPQIGRYPDNMKIGQLFDMIRDLRKKESVDDELITEFNLQSMYDKRMHTLSGGTRQKVSAALAFLFDAPIMILDEPTAGLDPLAVEVLKSKIRKEKNDKRLFLITSHIMSDLDELSSDVVYLEEGVICYNDTIAKIKSETGEEKFGKAIAAMMRRNRADVA